MESVIPRHKNNRPEPEKLERLFLLTQTSHIKKWVRSLKINTLAHKIAVTQPFVHVIMLPAYILADDEQSWL